MRSPFVNAELFHRDVPVDRRAAFLAWLESEGVPTNNLRAVTLGDGFLIATEYALNAEGVRYILAGTHDPAMHECRYPITAPPPAEVLSVFAGRSTFWEVEPEDPGKV